MKKILLSLVLSVATIFVFATKPHIDNVKVNPKTSIIKWIGSKISKSHEGTVNIQKGILSIDHGKLVGGQLSLDMNSIYTTDMSDKYNQKLNGHLKNEDFFNVRAFPLATITIKDANKGYGNSYKIIADLTIKGITHSITFQADVIIKGVSYTASAKIKIDRTKWDIKYNSGSFFKDLGDNLILDEIEFDILLLSVNN